MKFEQLQIGGAFLLRPELREDDRGFFARTACEREFRDHGISARFVQDSVSYNRRRGTLRGMHLQAPPHEEEKLVSCSQGSIYDVIVDLRPDSPTHCRWFAATLTATGLEALFIPKGCAHGFITLIDDSVVRYSISEFYAPGSTRGFRFDDPAFGIQWPLPPEVISPRDLEYARYDPSRAGQ
jgi:dTDP-4-dehydrorhamnose 3,5-epimerase